MILERKEVTNLSLLHLISIGDKSFPFKYEMRDAFLDFVDEPKDSARRTREGIYESYTTIVGRDM